jgi:hypothetical protein
MSRQCVTAGGASGASSLSVRAQWLELRARLYGGSERVVRKFRSLLMVMGLSVDCVAAGEEGLRVGDSCTVGLTAQGLRRRPGGRDGKTRKLRGFGGVNGVSPAGAIHVTQV